MITRRPGFAGVADRVAGLAEELRDDRRVAGERAPEAGAFAELVGDFSGEEAGACGRARRHRIEDVREHDAFAGEAVKGGDSPSDMGDAPAAPGQPPLSEADKRLVMHVELPILAGHVLMGTDATESMGFKLVAGNNLHINLETDTRAQTARLFQALAAGGSVQMPLQDMFWGAYFGSLRDRFGVQWMLNCASKD